MSVGRPTYVNSMRKPPRNVQEFASNTIIGDDMILPLSSLYSNDDVTARDDGREIRKKTDEAKIEKRVPLAVREFAEL